MKWRRFPVRSTVAFLAAGMIPSAIAAVPDTVGLSLLRAATTNADGSGIHVTQAEAAESNSSPPPFEVNPAHVGLPTHRFTYFVGPPATNAQSSSSFPNNIGAASGHAAAVASYFYGFPGGMSTNVAHIDNFEAGYFFETVVPDMEPIAGRVVVQAYIVPNATTNDQQVWDAAFDRYAAHFNTLFVSGIGNGGPVNPPSTCYNGIGVGAYGGASSLGPTPENGRAKPDLVAPADVTSYSTPMVAGAAAILLQAGAHGDGGSDTNAATDIRVVKALLLNGAIKPPGWSAPASSPLDPRHGSGVLNVFNSWNQLAGGKHGFIASSMAPADSVPVPIVTSSNVPAWSGWNFTAISGGANIDRIHHYFFELDAGTGAPFTATVTLTWNRNENQTLNDLDLLLCDAASGTPLVVSTSRVDNVEHLYLPALPPGRYDLRVVKRGSGMVTSSEDYALAFEFFAVPLTVAQGGSNVILSWPDYPDGFVLQSAPSPGSVWTNVNVALTVTNRQKIVSLPAGNASQLFRLKRSFW